MSTVKKKRKNNIVSITAFAGLVVVTLAIFAARQLAETGPRNIPRAQEVNSVTITLSPTPESGLIAGDVNEDGMVDGIDYVVWHDHYNQLVENQHKDGDFDRDGKVDGI